MGELHDAAEKGDTQEVRRLLDEGADVDAYDARRGTALHCAVYESWGEIVKLLIARGADVNGGADVNAKDGGDLTSLHLAAFHDDTEMAKILLDAGADVNARTHKGKTPLSYATEYGRAKMARLFKQYE
jgi:ankyrin repeat protein